MKWISDANKRGSWEGIERIPSDWSVSFDDVDIKFSLSPSDQGQVDPIVLSGVGVESNWRWIRETIRAASQNMVGQRKLFLAHPPHSQDDQLRVLNGFAYTGGSTLAVA
eukprot:113856-Hanusia_phi.AAC.1